MASAAVKKPPIAHHDEDIVVNKADLLYQHNHHKSSQSSALQTTQESTVRLKGTGRSAAGRSDAGRSDAGNDAKKGPDSAILVSCASGATLSPTEGTSFASISLSNQVPPSHGKS